MEALFGSGCGASTLVTNTLLLTADHTTGYTTYLKQ